MLAEWGFWRMDGLMGWVDGMEMRFLCFGCLRSFFFFFFLSFSFFFFWAGPILPATLHALFHHFPTVPHHVSTREDACLLYSECIGAARGAAVVSFPV